MRTICLLATLPLAPLAAREWTSDDGRTIEAEFVRMDGDKAVLMMNGTEYPVPLERLREADRKLARKLAEEAAKAAREVTIGDTTATPGGGITTFTAPLPEDLAGATGGKEGRQHGALKIGLTLPQDFDATTPQKFLWVWTPVNGDRDLERGSIPRISGFAREALPLGWAVFATDTDIGYPDGDDYAGLVAAAIAELEKAIPGFRDSTFATGGFSGGAKNATHASGALVARDLDLRGIFLAGCNDDLLPSAFKYHDARKSDYKQVRAFFSNGSDDRTASPERAETIAVSMDSNGIGETRCVTFDGGHGFHKPHIADALRWFEESASE